MPQLNLVLIWLIQKFFPDGRAFFMPMPVQTGEYIVDEDGIYITDEFGNFLVTEDYSARGGYLYRLIRAIMVSFALAWTDAMSISYALLPDNPHFAIDDARAWYRALGIYDSGLVSLADMKAAVRQKLSFPAAALEQQTATFITQQLQLAGFNVAVYENRFTDGMGGYITQTPDDILGSVSGSAELDDFELDDSELDEIFFGTMIANYIDEAGDEAVNITNWKSTFYIADPADITTFASVPEARKAEFRQLLLKLKSAHTIGILFVTYT